MANKAPVALFLLCTILAILFFTVSQPAPPSNPSSGPSEIVTPSATDAVFHPLPDAPIYTDAPSLKWPPVPKWNASSPPPLLLKDDYLETKVPLAQWEWDHLNDVSIVGSSPSLTGEENGISIRYGILAVPLLVYSRVLPLLNTSMRHADGVDVFLRKTNISYAVADIVRAEVARFHPNPHTVRIIELDGPDNNLILKPQSIRNAWMDLEVIRYWGSEHTARNNNLPPSANIWYCILDDDGYALIANAKAMIAEERAKYATGKAKDVSADPLIIGSTHMYRKKKFSRIFVVGGPGIYFNEAALVATYTTKLAGCLPKHVYGGGDIRASFCIGDAGATLLPIEHSYFDSPMRAIGEAKKDTLSPYPVGFHRMRHRHWGFRLAAIEAKRASENQLVSWDDIRVNFKEGPLFFRSQFYPREFDNYTMIYFAMTRAQLAEYNRKRRRPLDMDLM